MQLVYIQVKPLQEIFQPCQKAKLLMTICHFTLTCVHCHMGTLSRQKAQNGTKTAEDAKYDAKLVTSKLIIKEGEVSVTNNLSKTTFASSASHKTPNTSGYSLSVSKGMKAVITITDEGDHSKTAPANRWLTCGKIKLSKQDKQHILGGKELTDQHVNAFLSIACQQFPDVGAFIIP